MTFIIIYYEIMIPPKCLVSKSQAAIHIQCPHFLKHMSHYDLPNVDSGSTHLLFFFSLLAILYAANKEVLFQALAACKEVVSDSPGLVDFAIGLMNSVFNLPDGQVMFFEEFE